MTLLDSDLDREKRSDLMSRLRQLSKEDFQHHVQPLLFQRLEKVYLPDGFNTLEAFRAFVEDPSPVESVISSALERGAVKPEVLLERALEYQLPPQFVKSKFARICSTLSEDTLTDVLLPQFVNRPEYAVNIWREIGLSNSLAISIFDAALESRYLQGHRQPIKSKLEIPRDVIGQSYLAWFLVAFLREVQREKEIRFPPMHFDGRYMDYLLFQADSLIRDRLFSSGQPTEAGLEGLLRLAQESSAIPLLRASTVAFLSTVLSFRRESTQLDDLLSQLQISADKPQIEATERILFQTGAPSLETKISLSDMHSLDFGSLRSHGLRRFLSKISERFDELDLAPLFVLDSFDADRFNGIVSAGWLSKRLGEKIPLDVLRAYLRMVGYQLSESNPKLDLEFVAESTYAIANLIQQRDDNEWRAWPALARLTWCKWSGSNPLFSGSARGLENALSFLCTTLEERVDSLPGRWEVGGLLARSAEAGLDDVTRRLLNIVYRMPDGTLCARMSRGQYFRSLDANTIHRVFEVSLDSGDSGLRGFLKWFCVLVSEYQAEPGSPDSEIPPLHFDVDRVWPIIEGTDGSVRQGAILLLAHSGLMTFEKTRQFLEHSTMDSKPLDRAWAGLIKGTVRDFDSQEAIDFLENILSAGSKYPKAVKYAALEKYPRIIKTTLINIKQQEVALGLPLQDVA